jgi:hypothetical protein
MKRLPHGRAISIVGLVGLLIAVSGRFLGRTGRLTLDGIGLLILVVGGIWFLVEWQASRGRGDI